MGDACTCIIEDGIGVVTIDSPPVNALGAGVRRALDAGFRAFAADAAVEAVVLICAGRTFCAGADIGELGKPMQGPSLLEVFDIIERGSKPVVAAIHGTALGGGYEFAMICHYRIAVPSAKVGLPEVNLGLLPGGGGTQRLPRIVGVEAALELLTSGEHVPAPRALELGMIDALAQEGRLRADALAFARRILAENRPLQRVRDRHEKLAAARGQPQIFSAFLARRAQAFRGLKAPLNIVKAVEAAAELESFEAGLRRERELFNELWQSTEAAARRHLFSAERAAAKVPGVPPDTPARALQAIGVVGAGTLATGIAQSLLQAGLPVMRFDPSRPLDPQALARADLLIEAAELPAAQRRDLFGTLERLCRPDALMAIAAGFADLEELAAATARPDRILGLHLVTAPQNARLIEVARGRGTSAATVAAVMRLAKTMGKAAVLSGAGHHLIADRVMGAIGEALQCLLAQGLPRAELDRALYDFGFPDEPSRTLHSAGRGPPAQDEPAVGGILRPLCAPSADDIVAQVLYPAVNEGARLLEEGVALRASDIDVACVLGHGWPLHTGGPMFWADTVGLPRIAAALAALQARHGKRFEPAARLRQLAAEGGKFTAR
ncbi:MAG TPA: enoyl-CoA hydratase-related protein [Steroidobacteraceae bacterium]|nr:enoyl-CoA hydratase-related protein [Steroidobacteraceae bacterium]